MENKIEIWKDIPGYDYKYQISNLGRFKRITSFHRNREGEITKGNLTKGYLRVSLVKNKKSISKKVHRLVAEFFLVDYSEDLTVNHIDFVKTNNEINNLEIMSVIDNINHYLINKKKKHTSSSFIGISYHKTLNKWIAKSKNKSLGVFELESDALKAINDFKKGIIKEKKKGESNKLPDHIVKNILYLKDRVNLNQISEALNISIQSVYSYVKKPPYKLCDNYKPLEERLINLKKKTYISGNKHHHYKEKIGMVFINKQGLKYTIIRFDGKFCDIKFECGNIITNLKYDWVRKSRVKNIINNLTTKI